jgi:hypothetical protein
MKKFVTPILVAGLFTAGGCSLPVSVTCNYSTPKQTLSGEIDASTNGVTLSGADSATNQSVGGSVTLGK